MPTSVNRDHYMRDSVAPDEDIRRLGRLHGQNNNSYFRDGMISIFYSSTLITCIWKRKFSHLIRFKYRNHEGVSLPTILVAAYGWTL